MSKPVRITQADRDKEELLERQLELLHYCLHQEDAKSASETDLSWLTDIQKGIVIFLSKQEDNLSKEYIQELTKLRISLLGS